MIHLIAACASNGVIGRDGTMPWHIPADLQHFKELTMGHTVIMGRRTYESIGGALPGRQNIVVSGTLQQVEQCVIVPSLAKALAAAQQTEIFIIGGAQLYQEALPLAEQLDFTLIDASPEGDTFFPTVDWKAYEKLDEEWHDGAPSYRFVTYRKKCCKSLRGNKVLE